MTFARTVPLALVAAAAVLTGCAEDRGTASAPSAPSASPSATPSAEPTAGLEAARALVRAAVEAPPYSTAMVATTELGGIVLNKMTGTANLNDTQFTGTLRMELRPPTGGSETSEVVMGESAAWVRQQGDDEWIEIDRGQLSSQAGLASYGVYAEALLEGGEEVVKGRELTENGAEALRLSGRLDAEQVREMDPRVYDLLRSNEIDSFDCDLWIDDEGRVVKFVQWLRLQGQEAKNTVTFGDFAAPVAVRKPKN